LNSPSEGDLEKVKESEEARGNNDGVVPSKKEKRQEAGPNC